MEALFKILAGVFMVNDLPKNRLQISSQLLTHCMLKKNSADNILKYFSYFSKKIGFDTSCKLSPKETICMKCQILFSRKKKKKNISLSSAESPHEW